MKFSVARERLRDAWIGLCLTATGSPELVEDFASMRQLTNSVEMLGGDPKKALEMGARLTACGATEDQVEVYARMSATGYMRVEDAHLLRERGVDLQHVIQWARESGEPRRLTRSWLLSLATEDRTPLLSYAEINRILKAWEARS